jgi:hypothetical protein
MAKKMLFLITLAVMLTACLPSQQPTADVQAQVNTAVAGTMQANAQINQAVEQTVAAKEQVAAPTEAPTDLDNNVVLQTTATNTPFSIASATPTATLIPLKYTCAVYKKKPRDNEAFSKGEEFDVKFTVTNTGTRTWPKGIDFKYVGGTVLAGPKRVEIPKALAPGQSYEIVLDGKAPDQKGFYVMTYFVDGPMCYGYIAINVK